MHATDTDPLGNGMCRALDWVRILIGLIWHTWLSGSVQCVPTGPARLSLLGRHHTQLVAAGYYGVVTWPVWLALSVIPLAISCNRVSSATQRVCRDRSAASILSLIM